MGRRNRGLVDDLIEIGLAAPVVGVSCAVVFAGGAGYFQWANPRALSGVGVIMAVVLWMLSATAACGAAAGFVRQRLRRNAGGRVFDGLRSVDDLRRLSPGQFEGVIADLFRRQGFRVAEVGGPGDGGVDL